MADGQGQADLRGLDIDKLAKGFAEVENVFKQFCTVSSTSAREIRWYQKTSGFLDSTDTSGITASQIANTSYGSRPVVVEQTWTRYTSYVRKYFVESPFISEEDIKDTDIDILTTNVRDLVRGVTRQVDARIFDVLTESQSATNINTTTTTAVGGDQWDATSGLNPIKDVLDALRQIAVQGYDISTAVLLVSPKDYMSLITFIYNQGSQTPSLSDSLAKNGVLTNVAGCRVVVNPNVVSDYAVVFVPERAITYKEFTPITSAIIEDKGIGRKIRVWEEGEAILTDPKAVTLIIDTLT